MVQKIVAALLIGQIAAFPRTPPVEISLSLLSKSTVDTKNQVDCICDVTENSCDAHCCCDMDCGAVRKTWQKDPEKYCAKSSIGAMFKAR